MKFGVIQNNKPLFFFNQVKIKDNDFVLKITQFGNDKEKGLIDTGFTGGILLPNKYKAIVVEESNQLVYTLPTGYKIKVLSTHSKISFLTDTVIIKKVLFGEVKYPIIGIEFLKKLQNLHFDFENKAVRFYSNQ